MDAKKRILNGGPTTYLTSKALCFPSCEALDQLSRAKFKTGGGRPAGMKNMFGKDVAVSAQPEKTVVKAFARGQAQEGHLRRARERMGPRGAGRSQVGHPGVCCCLPKAQAQCAEKKTLTHGSVRLNPLDAI